MTAQFSPNSPTPNHFTTLLDGCQTSGRFLSKDSLGHPSANVRSIKTAVHCQPDFGKRSYLTGHLINKYFHTQKLEWANDYDKICDKIRLQRNI